jgi:hypothetical protein
MSREKERTLERWTAHPRIHCIQCLLALNFSFVLRVFHGFVLHVMGWCFHSLRTSLPFCTGA